jgi:hypothetical protein
MADSAVTLQVPDILGLERLVRQTHAFDDLDAVAVDRDPCGLLASVLKDPQCVEDVD